MLKTTKDVESYILSAPPEVRGRLREVRRAVKEAAPGASEGIGYGMPYYADHGRLMWFALAKAHIGLYFPPPIVARFSEELSGYGTTKSAVHLPLDETIPVALIKKMVRERLRLNVEKARAGGGSKRLKGKTGRRR